MMTRSTNTQGTAARLSAFTGMALIFGALALMSHHNGVAEEQNKDRTGAHRAASNRVRPATIRVPTT